MTSDTDDKPKRAIALTAGIGMAAAMAMIASSLIQEQPRREWPTRKVTPTESRQRIDRRERRRRQRAARKQSRRMS